VWAGLNPRFGTGIPVQVWGYTGGVATPMFTGTTDSVVDSWPGTIDAEAVMQATDGMKLLARHTGVQLPTGFEVGLNEFTGQRIHRLATDAGWTGPRLIDRGWTRMAATDLGGNTIDLMHEVGECEWGWLYVDEAGALVFRERDALQTDVRMTTVQWTFTDTHATPGICYNGDLQLSVDEASIWNIAQITEPNNPYMNRNSMFTWSDQESIDHFGPRTWTRSLPITEGALGVAQVVVMEYADDDKHIQSLTFNALPAANRNAAVNIRINDRIRVYRHYPGGFLLKQDLLVQGIAHHIVPSGEGRHSDPAVWDVTIRTATAAIIIGFGHWDDPSPDPADGSDHGWDIDQFGL